MNLSYSFIFKIIVSILLGLSSVIVTASEFKEKPSQEHNFEGASVRGKYKLSTGGSVVVENEKYLEDLLGVRKDFKDRAKLEMNRL